MTRVRAACLLVPLLAALASAQTVVTSSRFDPRLRQVDLATLDVIGEQEVTLGDAFVHGISALAREPGTGALFGVLHESRCPGDPGRTLLARGTCPEFSANPTTCAQAFSINNGVPVSCAHNGTLCAPCAKPNEIAFGCTNTCLGAPACDDPSLEFAGNGGCSEFSGDPATCVQKFALSECGTAPCYVVPSTTTCTVCEPFALALGRCTAACGPLASRDPIHLVTIDTANGVATSRGDLGDDVTGLAFDCEGALFGVTGEDRCRSDRAELVRIDATTADVTPGLTFPNTGVAALTFDAEHRVLLHTVGVAEEASLLAITPDTLASTVRPLSGPAPLDDVGDIAWEATTGDLLWSHSGAAGPLFRVPADGASVALGEVGRRINGIAFAEAAACATCGDGVTDAPEECDDAGTSTGCCADDCTLDPGGTPCAPDADPCTTDVCDPAGTCTHEAPAGLTGADCVLARLADPAVCAPDPMDPRLGRVLRKRANKARALVGKAVANPARAAKKLRAARRQLDAAARTVEKRRAKVTPACAATLDGMLEQVGPLLGA